MTNRGSVLLRRTTMTFLHVLKIIISNLSKVVSHASSVVLSLLIPILDTTSLLPRVFFITTPQPKLVCDVSCNGNKLFWKTILCQIMQFNAIGACKWVDDINTFEVFFTYLYNNWLEWARASCWKQNHTNCSIVPIFFCWSKFSFEKWSHIFELHLFLNISYRNSKVKKGKRVCAWM